MGILAAIEKRAHPSNPDRWLIRAFGGDPTGSGVEVTEDTALSATAVWAGVRLISETLAMLPLKLYERVDERSKKLARGLGLFRLLHDEPNPEQTSFEFREMQQGFLLTWGNCYTQKVYNGRGEVTELWPLVPWRVMPERTAAQTLVYKVDLPGGGQAVLPADDVLHIPGFSSTGLLGDNVIQRFQEAIGLSLAAERSGGAFYSNGAQAGGFLVHPRKIGPEGRKNLLESWNEQHQGPSRAHRVSILEEGLTWQQTTVDPEKAQALQTRKFQVTEVARILRLPPHLLYDLERSTNNNIEHQGQEFVTYSMQPWLTRWEQRMNRSLLLPNQRAILYTKFEVGGLLRGDSAARAAYYKSQFEVGAMSTNDIREKEDLDPVEGGDQRFVPLNMAPLDKVAESFDADIEAKKNPAPDPAAEEEEPDEDEEPRAVRPDAFAALVPVVRAEVERVVKRQCKAVRDKVKRGPQEFRVWVDGFFEKEVGLVQEALSPALLALAALTGAQVDARAFAQLDTDTAAAGIRTALAQPEDFQERVEALLQAWEKERVAKLTEQITTRPE